MQRQPLFLKYLLFCFLASGCYFIGYPEISRALISEEAAKPIKALSDHAASMDMIWTLIASFLIFLMQAGFTLVEVGFTRAKNAGNVVMKNIIDFAVGAIGFFFHRLRLDVRPQFRWFFGQQRLFYWGT